MRLFSLACALARRNFLSLAPRLRKPDGDGLFAALHALAAAAAFQRPALAPAHRALHGLGSLLRITSRHLNAPCPVHAARTPAAAEGSRTRRAPCAQADRLPSIPEGGGGNSARVIRIGRGDRNSSGAAPMTLSGVLLIILILALLGALPSWPYSRGWGYGPRSEERRVGKECRSRLVA